MSSSRFVRASKYRNVYCEPDKAEHHFLDLDLSTTTGDHNYIKANEKFFSVAVRGGGGPCLVLKHDQYGKVARGAPTLAGHAGPITDTEWHNFNPNVLFTASDDSTIGIWQVPDEGVKEKQTDPMGRLTGHGKTVTLLASHTTSDNILASVGKDHKVKIWDVEKCDDRLTLDGFGGFIQDLQWHPLGALIATSCKDKQTRVHDVRAGSVVAEWQGHEGAKASKALFLGDRNQVLTVGFTRQSKREMKGWDTRNTSEPLFHKEIDQSAGVLMPFYDDDTRILYLGGKGDGNIRYYEFVDEAPFVYQLSEHRTSVSAKGMAALPKRANDVMACETMRFLKLTPRSVEGLSFIVPRKETTFQEDIFPPCDAGIPSQSAEAWFGGGDAPPKKMSLNPDENPGVAARASKSLSLKPVEKAAPVAGAGGGGESGSADIAALEAELEEARTRIKELELENAALKAELGEKKEDDEE